MLTEKDKVKLKSEIILSLKTVYDPEIPVDIYELGLIYDIDIHDDGEVKLVMTLTTPNCPVADSLPFEVQQSVLNTPGVEDVDLELTFTPPWEKSMASEIAQLELGMF